MRRVILGVTYSETNPRIYFLIYMRKNLQRFPVYPHIFCLSFHLYPAL